MTGSIYGFSVPFRFPVYFTRDAFALDNATVATVLRRLEPERRHRVYFVIDGDVDRAHPHLRPEIEAYSRAPGESICLVGPPLVLQGGEAVKNDLSHPLAMLERINELGIDRQSFIAVIGGGAFLD